MNNKLDFEYIQVNTDGMRKESPRNSMHVVNTMNALTAKSTKLPITFIKDNKLQSYSPKKDMISDYLPVQGSPILSIENQKPKEGTYPKLSIWMQKDMQMRQK